MLVFRRPFKPLPIIKSTALLDSVKCAMLNARPHYWPITLLSIRLIFAYYPHGVTDNASSTNLPYNGCSTKHIFVLHMYYICISITNLIN